MSLASSKVTRIVAVQEMKASDEPHNSCHLHMAFLPITLTSSNYIIFDFHCTKTAFLVMFLQLVELLKLCLALEISENMLNRIEDGFRLWVEEYEK